MKVLLTKPTKEQIAKFQIESWFELYKNYLWLFHSILFQRNTYHSLAADSNYYDSAKYNEVYDFYEISIYGKYNLKAAEQMIEILEKDYKVKRMDTYKWVNRDSKTGRSEELKGIRIWIDALYEK